MGRNESPGKDNVFRKMVTAMLVAAHRQGKSINIKVITSRLQEANSKGITDVEALKAFVLEGLDEVSRLPERGH